jgi:hypothetical protein
MPVGFIRFVSLPSMRALDETGHRDEMDYLKNPKVDHGRDGFCMERYDTVTYLPDVASFIEAVSIGSF